MNGIAPTGEGVRLTVQVQPRARRSEMAGLHGDALKIRIAAPPVDGEANAELIRFLAEALMVPRGAVSLRSGAGSRRKVVDVAGLEAGVAEARLFPQD